MARPPRRIPRRQRSLYLSESTHQAIQRWQDGLAAAQRPCGLSDTVEAMIAVADAHSPHDVKMQPVADVLGSVPTSLPDWLRIDAHEGHRLRCSRCGETYEIGSVRFGPLLKRIAQFVEAHGGCEKT